MAKRKKENLTGNRRSSGDNPLAAARSRNTATNTAGVGDPAAIDWIEFGTTATNKRAAAAAATANSFSKRSRKAEQIWHRRSGAGFRLFVDYYREQPGGVVVVGVGVGVGVGSAGSGGEGGTAGSSRQQQQQQQQPPSVADRGGGAGRSRAALRRKKKRRRNPAAEGGEENPSPRTERSSASAAVPPVGHRHDQLLYNGRLLDAWASKPARNDRTTSSAAAAAAACSSEFRDFLTALSKPLPLTFRFRNQHGGSRRIRKIEGLRRLLETDERLARANVRPVVFDPERIYQATEPPRPPPGSSTDGGASRHPFPVDKASLKRLCPEYKEFLNEHTLDGTVARQELGSMLPVWLLQRVGAFSPRDGRTLRVLDTCASPGSKTLQVAELLSSSSSSSFSARRGRVRANDVNADRLESLKEAVQRSGFFSGAGDGDDEDDDDDDASVGMDSVIRYSNVDASRYPIPKSEAKKYSVILCDVPCSGDG